MMTNSPRGHRSRQMAQSYATVGLETTVRSASPVQLISMLYREARSWVTKAKYHMENGNLRERHEAIRKAQDIITMGLRASVDESQGEVAKSLTQSYDLMTHHLILANSRSQVEHLDIVLTMLQDIHTAWDIATGLACTDID